MLLGAPLNSSTGSKGEARAPEALRSAGLCERLDAEDAGDIGGRVGPNERDPQSGVLGLAGLTQASEELRDRVNGLLAPDRRLLVLGGDCTLLLGVSAALQRRFQRPGLWFVDGHTDTFDAASSPTGEAADMELGALTGHGPAQLTAAADRDPVIDPERVIVLGHRHPHDLEDTRELELVDERIRRIDARALKQQPRTAGVEAERYLRQSTDATWLHLDLDVLDETELPAVSYRQAGGLSWSELAELLPPLMASERLVGMSVADLQSDLDPDGIYARRIVELLAGATAP